MVLAVHPYSRSSRWKSSRLRLSIGNINTAVVGILEVSKAGWKVAELLTVMHSHKSTQALIFKIFRKS
ncbi:hypothetical protein WJX82_007854 [Trebouxia sp. C0006]